MPTPDPVLLSILKTALEEPFGLVLQTNDTNRARQALYKTRADAQDDKLSILQVRVSPFPDGDLVICHPRRSTSQSQNNSSVPTIDELPE